MKYNEWLDTLKVGDKVNAHYDGKMGRATLGEVVKVDKTVRVRFPAWGRPINDPRIVEAEFTNGIGYDTEGEFMREVLGIEEGDYYSLAPVK